jgi:hypothetical protein
MDIGALVMFLMLAVSLEMLLVCTPLKIAELFG